MKVLSSFTHPQVVPDLYEWVSSVEHKRRYFEENQTVAVAIDFSSILVTLYIKVQFWLLTNH